MSHKYWLVSVLTTTAYSEDRGLCLTDFSTLQKLNRIVYKIMFIYAGLSSSSLFVFCRLVDCAALCLLVNCMSLYPYIGNATKAYIIYRIYSEFMH